MSLFSNSAIQAANWISDREISLSFAPGALTPELRRIFAKLPPPAGLHTCLGAEVLHLIAANPAAVKIDDIKYWLDLALASPKTAATPIDSVVIQATYDCKLAEDISSDWKRLAVANGITPEEVIERHLAAIYVVAFCGFQPGFAYLEPMPGSPVLIAPRHDNPRKAVAAGTVALGGKYCGIYPASGPGGWNLIGRISTEESTVQTLRQNWIPGTLVRFVRATQ
jgi:KipI family sensor histidine kinase inhibitor